MLSNGTDPEFNLFMLSSFVSKTCKVLTVVCLRFCKEESMIITENDAPSDLVKLLDRDENILMYMGQKTISSFLKQRMCGEYQPTNA